MDTEVGILRWNNVPVSFTRSYLDVPIFDRGQAVGYNVQWSYKLSHGTVGNRRLYKKGVFSFRILETTAHIRAIPVMQKKAPAGRSISAGDLS